MILWRISNHATLDGRGGLYASGRWHTEGRPIVYLAENPAGALVEALVHLELDPARFPRSYRLLKAEAPEDLSVRTVAGAELPRNWISDQIATRTVGDEWLASKSAVLLRVPSVIVPETFNVLLNPEHAEAGRIQVLWHEEYPWAARLLRRCQCQVCSVAPIIGGGLPSVLRIGTLASRFWPLGLSPFASERVVPAVPRDSLHPLHALSTPVAVRSVVRHPTDLSQVNHTLRAGIAEAVGPQGYVVGVDRDAGLLELARKERGTVPHLRFERGDATNLNFRSQFDIVTAARTLQWIAEPRLASNA